MTNEVEKSRRRPVGVWLISAFYLVSAGWTLLSFALVLGHVVPLPPDQQAYFDSLTAVDWSFSVAIAALGVGAAVCLFLLRRIAVVLFAVALVLNLAFTAIHAMRTNWAEALGAAGLVGAVIGWLILVGVVAYAQRLAKRGVLR